MKTTEIKNLQTPEIQELDDSELSDVVGGGLFNGTYVGVESGLPLVGDLNTTLNLNNFTVTLTTN